MVILNIPKKIHLTCKDKHNIDNPVWKKCLDKYKSMYSDYEIIIHDNEDIYNMIETYYPEYLSKIKQIKIKDPSNILNLLVKLFTWLRVAMKKNLN